jgi:hypothetical protein
VTFYGHIALDVNASTFHDAAGAIQQWFENIYADALPYGSCTPAGRR